MPLHTYGQGGLMPTRLRPPLAKEILALSYTLIITFSYCDGNMTKNGMSTMVILEVSK